jgi:hypothetical protein
MGPLGPNSAHPILLVTTAGIRHRQMGPEDQRPTAAVCVTRWLVGPCVTRAPLTSVWAHAVSTSLTLDQPAPTRKHRLARDPPTVATTRDWCGFSWDFRVFKQDWTTSLYIKPRSPSPGASRIGTGRHHRCKRIRSPPSGPLACFTDSG